MEEFGLKAMHPKDAGGLANSVNPDQTAPLGGTASVCSDLSFLL